MIHDSAGKYVGPAGVLHMLEGSYDSTDGCINFAEAVCYLTDLLILFYAFKCLKRLLGQCLCQCDVLNSKAYQLFFLTSVL